MFVIMGATGHVGRAAANALLAGGHAVTILTRRPDKAHGWQEKGARVLEADAEDVSSMRVAFRTGRRAFLLNPPAAPDTDTDETEVRTARNIVEAVRDSGLEKVVAASTYGARPGRGVGDLTTLWELEAGLQELAIPAAINRGAFYMSNWIAQAAVVRKTGKLPSMFPADAALPMVAPDDLGEQAAARLLSPVDDVSLRYVEGPARYTPLDIANAFSAAMKRVVEVDVVPRSEWETAYRRLGFSEEAARAYTKMTAASLDEGFFTPRAFIRGSTTLKEFVERSLSGQIRKA